MARQRLDQESPGQTLQATALVHEVYLRLTRTGEAQRWENRRHFFGAAAEAMRRILIDRARNRGRLKRGKGIRETRLPDEGPQAPEEDDQIQAVAEAVDELAKKDPEAAELVKLRYFIGLKLPEVAEIYDVPLITVKRQWTYARAWLRAELGDESSEASLPSAGSKQS